MLSFIKGHTVRSEFSPEPLEELPRSSLNKFAFQVPLSRGTVRSTRRILPESESNESTRGTAIRNRKRARLSAIGVSENTMSKLQRCVCCEGQWKIKKSIYEKLNHIEACAKQHAHTLEMVSILIKRELRMAVETAKQENTDLPRSRFEEVVQDVSKRKSRSKKESTLEEFSSQKRVDAMKRLREILRTSNMDDPDIGPPSSSPVTFLPSRLLQSRRQAELSLSPEKTFHVSCPRLHSCWGSWFTQLSNQKWPQLVSKHSVPSFPQTVNPEKEKEKISDSLQSKVAVS